MKKRSVIKVMLILLVASIAQAEGKIKVLLIDGQNNHGAWPQTTPMIKTTLEKSGLFDVTHSQCPPDDGRRPNYGKPQPTVADMPAKLQEQWKAWRPDFSQYDVVVSNYNGVLWPDAVRASFEKYMKDGGGLVVIHAADNAFAQWEEYNKMIGVGGWYGRDQKNGPKIYWEDGKLVKDSSPGRGGSHGHRSTVLVKNVNPEHPIMKGMPAQWMHPVDEVYYNMRGPAENMTVLTTAYSNPETGGSGKDQPMLLTLDYHKGRVVHEMLGHDEKAFRGLGFQTTLIRGTEWAATGKVTFGAPSAKELPSDAPAVREPKDVVPLEAARCVLNH